jgi:hypothetical protein
MPLLLSRPTALFMLHITPILAVAASTLSPAWTRRSIGGAAAAIVGLGGSAPAAAFEAGADQEISGLVVLRVAEVCAFQEKLLRTLALCGNGKPKAVAPVDQFGNGYCDNQAYSVNPVQIVFGTGILLRNSNLDGNLKLMIQEEVPPPKRDAAIKDAVVIMNTFNKLVNTASTYTTFEGDDLLLIADIYAEARQNLARFFDFLPAEAKDRFYNYADSVRKYEEKVSKEDGIDRMKL